MDKAVLKKFAIESRQDLMQRIENKIKTFYIDEEFSKQQSGDVYILANSKHSLNLSKEEYNKRELLIKRINELGLDQVIEEAAYTWFNRIVAIRYMEIHDYLPLTRDNQSLGIRVLSSKDNTPDPEIMKFTNLVNPELDIDFKKEKYVELKDDNEKFKYILLLVCKKLGKVIPQVFDGMTDYIDILIPDNLLNDSGYITKLLKDVSEDNYEQVEIIGWLYQYYITEKKEKIKDNQKIGKEELPTVTQFFTPDWIVKYMVENSLGKFWIEHHGKKELIKEWHYYIETDYKIEEIIDPINIKCMDPCSGSGHILIYMFEVLYQIYNSCGYNTNDIAETILENNIYGLDIDNRAGQLSILSVVLKAREYDRNIFNKNPFSILNILSIQETNSINSETIKWIIEKSCKIKKNENIIETINYVYHKFYNAKEVGSLLNIEKRSYQETLQFIKSLENEELDIFDIEKLNEIKNILVPVIKVSEILSNKYDVVVMNPPYLGSKKFNDSLLNYINKNYVSTKYDLFASFINKGNDLIKTEGKLSMLTQQTWLNIDSYSEFRKNIIENFKFDTLLHLGAKAIDGGFGTVAFVLDRNNNENDKSVFIDLTNFQTSEEKSLNLNNKNCIYLCNTKNFLKVPNYVFSYKISKSLIELFNSKTLIKDIGESRSGLQTNNNDLFLKLWYEVAYKDIDFINNGNIFKKKWYPHIKGGGYRKWYGNFEYIVNWKNDGYEIKKLATELYKTYTRTVKNMKYYFKDGISWSLSTYSTKFSARILPVGFIFNVEAPTLYNCKNKLYTLGLLNSIVGLKFLDFLSDNVHYKTKDVDNVPYIYSKEYNDVIENIVLNNITISKEDWDSFETSWDFMIHPLIEYKEGSGYSENSDNWNYKIKDAYVSWKSNCDAKFKLLKNNEESLNKIFIDIYGLNDEITPEVDNKDISIRKADKLREIKSLISYAVGCMFGRYSLDKAGLIYAGGNFDDIYQKYKKTDGGSDVSSQSNYKYLNENGNEIKLSFEVDNDNIIPITDEAYFDDDIVQKFKQFIEVAFGKETLNENLDFIAETLGKKGTETSEETIRRYFVNDFFNDHCKIYQKRPIYWLLDSGKKNGFKALIYMHRYNENLIPKARLDYLHRVQTTYEKLLSDVNYKLTTDLSMVDKKDAQKRQANLNAKLQEIKEYDEKIAHIANQRISIDLDDGVKVNYEKFKDILAKIK